MLNKWEKIFTNWLIEVSKEKGRREAKQNLKKIKSEFKKVVALNSYLHNQIESINDNKILKESSPSSRPDKGESLLGTSPFLSLIGKNVDHENFKTANPLKDNINMKENVNMYLTQNNKDLSKPRPLKDGLIDMRFPEPPLIKDSENSDNFALSSMMHNSDSNSSNEIENIIILKSNERPYENLHKPKIREEWLVEEQSETPQSYDDSDSSPSVRQNMRSVRINPYLDKAKISSSILLENIADFYQFPMKTQPNEDSDSNYESRSPIIPMNLDYQLTQEQIHSKLTPELLKRASSSDVGDMHEGEVRRIMQHMSQYNDSKLILHKGSANRPNTDKRQSK